MQFNRFLLLREWTKHNETFIRKFRINRLDNQDEMKLEIFGLVLFRLV